MTTDHASSLISSAHQAAQELMPAGQPGLSKTKGNSTFGPNVRLQSLVPQNDVLDYPAQGFCDSSWYQQPVRSSITRQAACCCASDR